MVNNPFSLEGKTILVTGASSGIGRGICIQCSKMGAKVVLTGRNQERLNETISMMEGEGHISLAYDLTNNDNVAAMVDECPELNGIVHCAGVSQIVMAKKLNYEAIDDIFKTNVYAPLNLNATLLKNKKVAKINKLIERIKKKKEENPPRLLGSLAKHNEQVIIRQIRTEVKESETEPELNLPEMDEKKKQRLLTRMATAKQGLSKMSFAKALLKRTSEENLQKAKNS